MVYHGYRPVHHGSIGCSIGLSVSSGQFWVGKLCKILNAHGNCYPNIISQCQTLATVMESKVLFPNSTAYDSSVSSYWSAQEQSVRPSCILYATSARDVSKALQVIVAKSCEFAVRSGGHGALKGLANVQDGVTIDLRGLNSIEPFRNNSLVAIGGGQTVGNVYAALQPLGLTISGGRSYDVGVGGSTLGGGWGWMSNEAGWSCDNIVEYEVVLASGEIVTATNRENTSLWRALKGGGSNFGVVTNFVHRTLPIGEIWAGDANYNLTEAEVPQLLNAAYDFTSTQHQDSKASILFSFTYDALYGPIYWVQYVYLEPVTDTPPLFEELLSLPGEIRRDISLVDLTTFSYEYNLQTPSGLQ